MRNPMLWTLLCCACAAPAAQDAGVEPRDAGRPADAGAPSDGGAMDAGVFSLSSTAFVERGPGAVPLLPTAFTCYAPGGGISPPLQWQHAPPSTAEYALLVTTLARDGLKYNWVVWGIPPSATGLAAGSTGGGTAGLTSDGPQLAYAPPCSQGPGEKQYTFTLYALSAAPRLSTPPGMVRGDTLAADIAPLILQQASVTVGSTRQP